MSNHDLNEFISTVAQLFLMLFGIVVLVLIAVLR